MLSEAERWRGQIIGEVTRKVAEIQNAGLGEARLRDLNDEINKLLREKGHWERQIVALGGPNHARTAAHLFDADSRAVPGGGGYRYFGAARDLPGVAELFAKEAAEQRRRTRGEIVRGLTPDYYGYRDEDDGVLLAAEAAAEAVRFAAAAEEVAEAAAASHAAKRSRLGDDGSGGGGGGGEDDGGGAAVAAAAAAAAAASFHAHVPLPSATDIEALLVAKKKALLLARYAPDAPAAP